MTESEHKFEQSRRHPYMKAAVRNNDHCCCFCGNVVKETDKMTLHCPDGFLPCHHKGTVMVDAPTPRNKKHKRRVPDCKECYQETSEKFIECRNQWRVAHLLCYQRIILDINHRN